MPKRIPSDPARRWHRLFGLLLTDYLRDSPFTVELEKDLSHRQQLLDVVIVRRAEGAMSRAMPDGLQDLANHNLITFKSFWEPFDDWTLKELTGHYVNYRKQSSRSGEELLPEEEFRLFGICARYPQQLLQAVAHEKVQDGVYDCRRGTDVIRLIVARDLPKREENSLLHLFSAAQDQVKYAAEHYDLHSPDISSIVNQLFGEYRREGLTMPYTMEDFKREVALEYLDQLTLEERLRGVTPKEILQHLSDDQIKAYLSKRRKSHPQAKQNKPKRRG
jgi:hypothetical protein